jgi:hypothetical protein
VLEHLLEVSVFRKKKIVYIAENTKRFKENIIISVHSYYFIFEGQRSVSLQPLWSFCAKRKKAGGK